MFPCVCGTNFADERGLETHLRRDRCRGPPTENDRVCPECGRRFDTFAGMRQHHRKAHRDQHDRQLELRYEGEAGPAREWSEEDTLRMARAEAAFTGKHINQHLQGIFPGRTVDALKYRRRKQEYKDLVEQLKNEVNQAQPGEAPLLVDPGDPPELNPFPPQQDGDPIPPDRGLHMAQNMNIIHPIWEANDPLAIAIRDFLNSAQNLTEEDLALATLLDVRDLRRGDARIAETIETYLTHIKNSCTPIGRRNRPNNIRTRTAPMRNENPNRTGRRVGQYKTYQNMFREDRARLAEVILDGVTLEEADKFPDITEVETSYRDIFDRVGPDDDAPFEAVDHRVRLDSIFTAEEVDLAFNTNKSDAAGPDGIKPSWLKKLPRHKLICLFNIILLTGYVPPEWKLNRTILIPKAGDPVEVGNWRPITISSALQRIMNKILAKRMALLPLHQNQRGFRRFDGVLANTLTLQAIIKECRAKLKPHSVLTLDLRKAFDTVSHASILRSMRRFCVSERLILLVEEGYRDTCTTVSVGGNTTGPIRVRRGVRQGDPLSPILFNLVLDELIHSLENLGSGVRMGTGTSVSCLGYADDMLILSNSIRGAQNLLGEAADFFSARGMALNHDKCTASTTSINRGNKHIYAVSRSAFSVEGVPIRQMVPSDQYKYLGRRYDLLGQTKPTLDELDGQINNIIRSPLKPQQKLVIIKSYLIPRYLDKLQSPVVTLKLLKTFDRKLRVATRRILRLNRTSQDAFLHAPVREGGIGLLCLRDYIPLILKNRMWRLGDGRDQLQTEIMNVDWIRSLSERILRWCGEKTSGSRIKIAWSDALQNGYSGNGLQQGRCHIGSGSWINRPPPFWSGADFSRAMQLRGNLLPTKGIPSNPPEERKCRAGCQRVETLCHVLQKCPMAHFCRVRRHDHLVDCLAKNLQKKGFEVETEPRIRSQDGRLRKPDIVCAKGDRVLVVELGVSWEGPDPLSVAWHNKRALYEDPGFLAALSLRYPGKLVSVTPVIVGARGTWCASNRLFVEATGYTKQEVAQVCERTLLGGIIIHRNFMKQMGPH